MNNKLESKKEKKKIQMKKEENVSKERKSLHLKK